MARAQRSVNIDMRGRFIVLLGGLVGDCPMRGRSLLLTTVAFVAFVQHETAGKSLLDEAREYFGTEGNSVPAVKADEATLAKLVYPIRGPVVARVVRIDNGETIYVEAHPWPGVVFHTNIRLRGINAPKTIFARCDRERQLGARARDCPSSKQMGLLSVFHKGGSGSSLFDVKPLGFDGSSGGFGWSVF